MKIFNRQVLCDFCAWLSENLPDGWTKKLLEDRLCPWCNELVSNHIFLKPLIRWKYTALLDLKNNLKHKMCRKIFSNIPIKINFYIFDIFIFAQYFFELHSEKWCKWQIFNFKKIIWMKNLNFKKNWKLITKFSMV